MAIIIQILHAPSFNIIVLMTALREIVVFIRSRKVRIVLLPEACEGNTPIVTFP